MAQGSSWMTIDGVPVCRQGGGTKMTWVPGQTTLKTPKFTGQR